MRVVFWPGTCLTILMSVFGSSRAWTQELVPRAFWPSPVGTHVVSLSYQRSQGDILVDQSLPITDVNSKIDYLVISYQRTLDLGGRTAVASLNQVLSDGSVSADFEDGVLQRRTVGAGDTTARLAVNILGAPAMDRAGFAELRSNPTPIVGTSLTLTLPTGEYENDRVINLGGNRWSIKPALGVIYPLGNSWLLESELSVTFYENNDDFLGVTREQEPVANAQLHLIKLFSRGLWAALDANYYAGGRTIVAGQRNRDRQRNSRFGATLVWPFAAGYALRVGVSTGAVTEVGGDYDLVSLSWIHAF